MMRAARSSNFAQSLTDVTEAYELGMSAHMRSADPAFTAQVVGIERGTDAQGGTHMLPAVPEFVQDIDLDARTITVTPIDGMFTEAVNGDKE